MAQHLNRRTALAAAGGLALGAAQIALGESRYGNEVGRFKVTRKVPRSANAKGILKSLRPRRAGSNEPMRTDPPPIVRITNNLPDGYPVTVYGAGFWYRRNSEQDPETILIEDDPIAPGQTKEFQATREDCCYFLFLAIDITTPSGDVETLTGSDEAPSGQCIIVSEWTVDAG